MEKTVQKLTLSDIRRDYPGTVPCTVLAKYFGKKPQSFRNMVEKGHFPFAIVEKRKTKNTYVFPTERFVAWSEGRLQA